MANPVLLLVFLAAGQVSAAENDRRTAVTADVEAPEWSRAVAKLALRTKKGTVEYGSAVLVSSRLALTAHHCVKHWHNRALLLFGYDGLARKQIEKRYAVEIVAKSVSGDWAILRLDKPIKTIKALVASDREFRKCDTKRMLLAGYSCDKANGRGGLLLTYDDKCKLKKLRTDAGRILTDAICYDGASGGPAFVKDKESDRWHWQGIVQGNINPDSKTGRVTYAVYQPLYLKALGKAVKEYP